MNKALEFISYGLFVVTAKGEKPNGCVANTFMQVTSNPTQATIVLNKSNFTTSLIEKTGEFNVSILNKNTRFELIKRFGFSSGRETNKFDGFNHFKISSNGIPYITENTNSYFSCNVKEVIDVGTHLMFVAEITESEILTSVESLTYSDYFKYVKPKVTQNKKNSYVCKICGYVHEGENLPEDFICPICKHGADAFTKVETKETTKKEYYCPLCGYVETSEEEVSRCRICGAKMIQR